MKPVRAVEIDHGTAAFERFRRAVKAVLAVPKSAIPPRPNRRHAKAAK